MEKSRRTSVSNIIMAVLTILVYFVCRYHSWYVTPRFDDRKFKLAVHHFGKAKLLGVIKRITEVDDLSNITVKPKKSMKLSVPDSPGPLLREKTEGKSSPPKERGKSAGEEKKSPPKETTAKRKPEDDEKEKKEKEAQKKKPKVSNITSSKGINM